VKLHPRFRVVKEAELALSMALLDLEKKHELTYAEVVLILTAALSEATRYALREERHGDAVTPSGLADD